MPDTLRQRHRSSYQRASNPKERRDQPGWVTVDKDSYIALIELAQMGPDVDTEWWRLGQTRAEDIACLRRLAATASDDRSRGCYLHAAEELERLNQDGSEG